MIVENIYKFIDYKSITVYEFSKLCGLSNGYLAKQRANKGNISSQIINKILKKYPEINLEWLLSGKGNMIKATYPETDKNRSLNESTPIYNHKKEIDQTKILSKGEKIFYASPALSGQSLYSKERKTSASGQIRNIPHLSSSESFLPVIGYSMPPEIKEGSIIGVKQITDLDSLNTERACLLITEQECMICLVKQDPNDTGKFICSTPREDIFLLEKSKLIELHRITAIISPM